MQHLPVFRIVVIFLDSKRVGQRDLARHAVLIHVTEMFILEPD